MAKREKWIDPKNWASLKPFGIGEGRPNNYAEIRKAFRENRGRRGYAWRILKKAMVHQDRDTLTGAVREAVLMNPADADRHGLTDGDQVRLTSGSGELRGRVLRAPVALGNLQVHSPEGEVLIDRARPSPQAGIPDYNAVVTIARAPD